MKTIEKPKTGKATRPASRWRNRYLAFHDFTCTDGISHRAGQEYWGVREWPSRDIAETYGQWWEAQPPRHVAKYLGAFPVKGA